MKNYLKYKKILVFLSSLAVFFTTYFLILPAITLESEKVGTGTDNTLGIVLETVASESSSSGLVEELIKVSEPSSENEAQPQESLGTESLPEESLPEESLTEEEAKKKAKENQALITEGTVLSYQGSNYTVYAAFGASAKFPKGIELKAEEISSAHTDYAMYKGVVDGIFQGGGNAVSFLQLFDIHFEYEGEEYQPSGEVEVKIEYTYGPASKAGETFHVVHFAEDNMAEIFESESTSKETLEEISVKTYTFSVYGVARSADNTPIVIGGKSYYTATFNYINDSGENKSNVILIEAVPGATLGTLPKDPFVAGKRFVRWVDAATNAVVGESTRVTGNMQINAEFETIEQYEVRVNYIYYNNAQRQDVVFDTEVYKLAEYDLPYKIKTPVSSVVKTSDDSTLQRDAIYYPEFTEITLQNQAELDAKDAADGNADRKVTLTHRYGPTDAVFHYVYKLKNLNDNNYADVKRVEGRGMVGSTVTAPIEVIPYAVFERTEATEIFYEEGQEIPVYYRRGNAQLTFETNGGSYVNRITDTYGKEVPLPNTAPTKTGYTFDGWYEDAALTKKVASSNVVLDKDKTLYAKWKPANTKYTILYYRYEYDENDYIGNTTHEQNEAVQPKERFIGSAEGTANTGTTIQASTIADFTGIDASTGLPYITGYQKYAAKNNTSVVVQPDGSSVIKVYYEPKTYTYEFLTRRNNAVITHLGNNEGNSYSFTAKTGQYIAQKWPVNWVGTNRTITSGDSTLTFLRWAYAGSTQGSITMQQFVSNEHIQKADPSGKITYHAMWASSNNIMYLRASNGRVTEAERYGTARVNYYFEKEGQPGVYERNALQSEDITFEKIQNITAKGFTGYDVLNDGEIRALASSYPRTRQANAPAQNGTTRVGNTVYPTYPNPPLTQQRDVHNGKTYDRIFEFYYKFKRYEIQYKHNGTEAAPTKSGLINGTNINTATYNFVPTRPAGVDADYTWGGWYTDAGLLNPAFSGTTPELIDGNKVLYAKWIPPKFNVNFDLNGGTSTTPIATQTLDKYQRVTVPPAPTKKFHTFVGWYTAPTGGSAFDFTTPITKNTTLYARWQLNPVEYTIKYLDAETGQPILAEKHVQGPDLVLGQVLGEADGIVAVGVPGYRPQELHKTLTLTDNFDNNVAIFYYDKRNSNLTYTVDYVLQSDPTKKVATSKVETAGATVIKVRELAKAVDKAVMRASGITGDALLKDYYPVNQSEELVISSNEAHNRIVFEYVDRDTAIIEINYFDMDGNPIPGHNKRVEALNTPNILQTATYKKEINGYTYYKVVDGSRVENKDTYIFSTGSNLVLNYYYQKNLTIKPRSDTKVYDARPLNLVNGNSNDVVVSAATPLARGHLINQITYTNHTITNVGSVNPTISRVKIVDGSNRDKTNYYKITFEPGTLTITPKPVTITVTGEQKSVVYDGNTHEVGYTITSNDPSYYSEANKSNLTVGNIDPIQQKNVGQYVFDLVNNLTLTNQNNNYEVSFNKTDGVLNITQRPASITSRNVANIYTGGPQTAAADAVDFTGFVNNEERSITITPTGVRTVPGVVSNTFDYTSDNLALLTRNYAITTNYGNFEVLPTINLQKTDSAWNPLEDARFELYRLDTNGIYASVPNYNNVQVGTNGFNLQGLPLGRYRLKEIQAPDGYIVLNKYIYFDLVEKADQSGDYDLVLATGNDGIALTEMRIASGAENYSHRLQAVNQAGASLPNTGGEGTSRYSLLGMLCLMLVATVYVFKQKSQAKKA